MRFTAIRPNLVPSLPATTQSHAPRRWCDAMRFDAMRRTQSKPYPTRPGPARPDATPRNATQRDATQRNATQRNATQKPPHLNVGHRQHVLGRAENLVAVPRKAILLGGVAQHSQSGATLSRAVVLSNTQARPRHDLLCTSRSTQNIVEAKVRMGGRLESG